MYKPKFSKNEQFIVNSLPVGTTFSYNNSNYKVNLIGKPTCAQGEPKTDIYIKASTSNETVEFKISYKRPNADFIENKTNTQRAEDLFGTDWKSFIMNNTKDISNLFDQRALIFKNKSGRTNKGSITLGWKYEVFNKKSGDLSAKLNLTKKQVLDIYAGTSSTGDKRDSYVNGKQIKNSGIVNFMLITDDLETPQRIIDQLIPVKEYVNEHDEVYFACKALNYRTFHNKYDGNRPLAVWVDWSVKDGKLTHTIKYNSPLITKGNEVANKLIRALENLNVKNTDNLNSNNIADMSIVIE